MYKTKRINSSRYAYATGRIRAREVRLISAARISRFLEATTAEDIGRLLSENGYPAAADPEVSLNLELQAAYALIRSLSANPEFIDTLLLPRDFHNLKVMLKAFAVYWPRREAVFLDTSNQTNAPSSESDEKTQPETTSESETNPDQTSHWPEVHGPVTFEQLQPMLQRPSTVDPQLLFNALREQKPAGIPSFLFVAATNAAVRYQKTYEISEIDILLDKTMAQLMSDAAGTLNEPFFSGYIRLRFDLINIGILMRTRFLTKGKDYLKNVLLPGGSLNHTDLLALYEESTAQINRVLSKTPVAGLSDAIEHFAEGGDAIAQFSLASDNLLIKYIQKARTVLRGPQVLIGYLVAREMEIKTVRMILTCLRNRIPQEQARELARLTYL